MIEHKITHVAIVFEGVLYSLPAPNRHHDVIRHICETTGAKHVDARDEEQGFLDETGRYLTRKQACHVATTLCQVIRKTEPKHLLFSEDLW